MKRSIYVVVLVLSVLLVLSSVYWSVTVYSQVDLANAEVKLGLPLPFVLQSQDLSLSTLPTHTSIRIPLENPTQILLPQFILNVVIVFGMLSFIFYLLKTVGLRVNRR